MAAALNEKEPDLYRQVDPAVYAKDWVVHSQPAGRGQEALGYLSGYVQKSAITNRRILADDHRGITFAYTESGTGERKTLRLEPMRFIARVLAHALPEGLHRVRYFGWMHPRAKARLMQVQTLLSAPLVFQSTRPGAGAVAFAVCGLVQQGLLAGFAACNLLG